ncbi:type II toxin-antitoxin system Phd/YefM family antitoxin [Patescibacteria group bacterium]|nr:type II toxin-antitoxin system Phd/YefM family antitoxin [Patescibacteria group bacterium]MBU1931181.1 type II toxin-antitoxin system Phd/YefM family antitoxin [Patescibacteria group bacterium]
MTNLPTVLPASQARSNFYTMLDEVENKFKRFTVTLRGKAKAVMMNPEEVAAWEETMDIMSNKKLVAQIVKSEAEMKAGKVVSEKELLKELNINPEDLE